MIVWVLRYWYVWSSGVSYALFLGMLERTTALTVLLPTFVFLIGLVSLVYYRIYARSTYKMTVAITILSVLCGGTGLYLLLDGETIRLAVQGLVSILLAAVVYIPQQFTAQLAHEYKPWRRLFVSIMTAALAMISITLYGIHTFFQAPSILWYTILIGLWSGIIAYATFRLYYPAHTHRQVVWAGGIAVTSAELFLATAYLPFGYLWLALVFMVYWYTVVILVRFHLSAKGIVWKKQLPFLTGAVICTLLLFLFARWV